MQRSLQPVPMTTCATRPRGDVAEPTAGGGAAVTKGGANALSARRVRTPGPICA
jgi:hypothetical protein